MTPDLDFLVIGSQRCATTYIRSVFKKEKIINVSKKEVNFFSHHIYNEDLCWYFDNFDGGGVLTGEISPSYFLMRPSEIRYLKELYPNVKIVLILRDPVKRMWSSIHRHWTYSYLEDTKKVGTDFTSLLKFIMTPTNSYFGRYSFAIEKWGEVFDKNQIKILFYEELKQNPKEFISELYFFLNINKEPIVNHNPKNVSKIKKSKNGMISYIIYKIHKKDIQKLIKMGYVQAKIWEDKYENNFKNQKIPFNLKLIASTMNFIINYIYDPINVLIDWRRKYKLKKRKDKMMSY